MNEIIHQLILKAVNQVFEKFDIYIERVETTSGNDAYELIVNIGLLGDLKGCLMFRCNLQTAKNLVTKLFLSTSMTNDEVNFGKMHQAAIGELVNQISAQVTMLLYENSYNCSITPPTFIIGKQIKSSTMDLTYSYSSNILCESGIINLYFSLKG
jgi:CheY-specific phosphatase CheX